jgi:hypothetical protein
LVFDLTVADEPPVGVADELEVVGHWTDDWHKALEHSATLVMDFAELAEIPQDNGQLERSV